jgi:hypothetical protein
MDNNSQQGTSNPRQNSGNTQTNQPAPDPRQKPPPPPQRRERKDGPPPSKTT